MDNCNKFKLPKNNENNKKDSIYYIKDLNYYFYFLYACVLNMYLIKFGIIIIQLHYLKICLICAYNGCYIVVVK